MEPLSAIFTTLWNAIMAVFGACLSMIAGVFLALIGILLFVMTSCSTAQENTEFFKKTDAFLVPGAIYTYADSGTCNAELEPYTDGTYVFSHDPYDVSGYAPEYEKNILTDLTGFRFKVLEKKNLTELHGCAGLCYSAVVEWPLEVTTASGSTLRALIRAPLKDDVEYLQKGVCFKEKTPE